MKLKRTASGLFVPAHLGIVAPSRGPWFHVPSRTKREDRNRYEEYLDWAKRQPKLSIARVQAVAGQNGSGSTSYNTTIASTSAGNLIVVCVGSFPSNANVLSVTDNLSSSYSTGYNLSWNGTRKNAVFYLANNPGGITTITINLTVSCTSSVAILEYSGIATASPLDQAVSAINFQTAVTTWASNSITTTSIGLLLGISTTVQTGNAHFVSTAPWATAKDAPNATDADEMYVQEQLNVIAGTYNAAGTADSHNYGSGIISFKAAASASVVPLNILHESGRYV